MAMIFVVFYVLLLRSYINTTLGYQGEERSISLQSGAVGLYVILLLSYINTTLGYQGEERSIYP
jgi:hypothetical protein